MAVVEIHEESLLSLIRIKNTLLKENASLKEELDKIALRREIGVCSKYLSLLKEKEIVLEEMRTQIKELTLFKNNCILASKLVKPKLKRVYIDNNGELII